MEKVAREMFENLGYENYFYPYEKHYVKQYKDGREIFITFDLRRKKVAKGKCGLSLEYTEMKDIEISMKELEAINKQVEELGWK